MVRKFYYTVLKCKIGRQRGLKWTLKKSLGSFVGQLLAHQAITVLGKCLWPRGFQHEVSCLHFHLFRLENHSGVRRMGGRNTNIYREHQSNSIFDRFSKSEEQNQMVCSWKPNGDHPCSIGYDSTGGNLKLSHDSRIIVLVGKMNEHEKSNHKRRVDSRVLQCLLLLFLQFAVCLMLRHKHLRHHESRFCGKRDRGGICSKAKSERFDS